MSPRLIPPQWACLWWGVGELSAFIRAECPLRQAMTGTPHAQVSAFLPTGVFTAPYDGRYLITATLTPERDAYVEAVLSVANASVAQLHTAGYRREFLEYHRPQGAPHTCGGPGAFHLIVHLKAGDGVNIVVTGGRLAHTDFDEMYSTFSGVFLYPFLSHL